MNDKHIPVLAHLKTSLVKVQSLISELASTTAAALEEMEETINQNGTSSELTDQEVTEIYNELYPEEEEESE